MEKSVVVLMPCATYEAAEEKIEKGMALLGGIDFIPKSDRILVKPNLLMNATPDKAATTHPKVFGGVSSYLRKAGYENVSYGDSPGSPIADLEKTVEVTGLKEEAERYQVPLADFSAAVNVKYPAGRKCKKFTLCKAFTEADSLISVCKMKTHALENITGAVKNQYGCIYSANKALGHALYPNSRSFAEMLIDLNQYLKPKLYIMDGVVAMEGNGPSGGDPVSMGVILLSKDPVALDTVFAHLVYLRPEVVPTNVYGENMGLGHRKAENIEIRTEEGILSVSEMQERYGKKDFQVKRDVPHFWRLGFLLKPLKHTKKDRPVVDTGLCIGCGVCQESCPVEGKAVHSGQGQKAVYDYKKCIRCYCCQEMCPVKAIHREG